MNIRFHKQIHLTADAQLTPTFPIVLPSVRPLIGPSNFLTFNASNYCNGFHMDK